ncbi:PREDICTED: transmembrane protein 52 [Gavialis gangeticus]|uniref:transmembrane protein 52 n=1 Tax=Gavialis gangeticus TaxID=94835 RepID=UPI00092E56F7|nr:PREDICTED: transmembrane protein 52 [Gavialis gangeticus]
MPGPEGSAWLAAPRGRGAGCARSMAGDGCNRRLLLLLLLLTLLLLQAAPGSAQTTCEAPEQCTQNMSNWTSLWYVWLILLTVFMLLLCGITASCVKICCRKKRPPVQAFPRRPYDLTVITIDNDSTAHSTVTSYSSLQYPQSTSLPLPFGDMDRSTMSPPAYSLYAMELPPSYDEAIKMGKPYTETVLVGQKPSDASEQGTPEEPNQHQGSSDPVPGNPETQPSSDDPQVATEQPQF